MIDFFDEMRVDWLYGFYIIRATRITENFVYGAKFLLYMPKAVIDITEYVAKAGKIGIL